MIKAIVGSCWGDEGKGKITDMMAADSDVVIRYQGGSNAGHTIINDYGKFALHQLPSGVFYNHTTNIIGNGVALDPGKFIKELNTLRERGVPDPKILVSDRTQVLMPYHILFDECEEARLAGKQFGSTKSGIAPFYADKYSKIGIQVSELYDDESALREKISGILTQKNAILTGLYNHEPLDEDVMFAKLLEYREMLRPFVADTFEFLCDARAAGKTILLEGQLGALKDPDFGIYPMVTSSNTLAGYGTVGAGVPPYEIQEIVSVVKAYSSAVGGGEFVSELFGTEAEELRRRGGDAGEYGATTGRPRRVGWLDLVASKYGCRLQGATKVAFTVLDVLGYLDELKVCVGYEIDGVVTDKFPNTVRLKRAKPVYKTFPGWKCEIKGIRDYRELPEACKRYIEFAEEYIGIHIGMISNGPSRNDIILR